MDNDFLKTIVDQPLSAVADYYASCLEGNDKANTFIKEELKLTAEQAHEQRIGFADRSLGKKIPHKRIKVGREVREILETAGVYKANGRETLRGYVTVPIIDQGSVIGIRGHKLDPHASGESVIVIGEKSGKQRVARDEEERTVDEANRQAAETSATKAANNPEDAGTTTTNDANNTNEIGSDLVIEDSQIVFHRDDRRYRIRGLEKNASACTLKVSLMASRDGLVHLDALDLVKARSRASFIKAAALELYVDEELVKRDIGQLLLKLETLQSERLAALKQPQSMEVKLSDDEEREALSLLRSPRLLERIVADIDACGMVGEGINKLAGYLAATSRKLESPLAVVIQSSSSAGKTSLMDAILAMMPSEDVRRFSGMTGQSLFYLDSDKVKHKILAISEGEGIGEAAYALKLLQSDGELRHATVGRGENGRAQTQEHHVEGPVQIFLTTTAMQIDEELGNRCLVLSVDETDGQTGAIQSKQREAFTVDVTESGFAAESLRKLHQNAQRLLRPMKVFNPYAPQLTFPNHKTRMRRDHVKYLTLINTIAFLHQHQRTVQSQTINGQSFEFINVERHDIAVANGLAGEVLGRSLDELSPQTRNLLGELNDYVDKNAGLNGVARKAFRFTRRDIREATLWSNSQISIHLNRLVDLEYVYVHRGRNGQRYVYELLYAGEGREGQPFLMGLLDPSRLKEPATMTKVKTFRGAEATFRPEKAS